MKKIIFLILTVFTFNCLFAQSDSTRLNAISIGAKVSIASTIELAYDRILTPHTNFEVSFGIGNNLINNFGNNFYQNGIPFIGGTKIELYPNGHRQNMIRFFMSLGMTGTYSNNDYLNYSFGPAGGVGLGYFGKKGFHFKIENSINVHYYSYTYYQNYYYYGYGGNGGNNGDVYTATGTTAFIKPSIRIGYRF